MKPRLALIALMSLMAIEDPIHARNNPPKRQGYEEHPELFGNVDSVIIKIFNSPEAVEHNMPSLVHNYTFNQKGDIEKSSTSKGTGELMSNVAYNYNNISGLLIEKTTFNEAGHPIQLHHYTHDERGNIVGTSRISGRGTSNLGYVYDSNNRLAEAITYANQEVAFRLQYQYDSNGNKVKTTTYNADSVVIAKLSHLYTYSPDNKIEESATLDSSNTIVSRDVFSYNNDGHVDSCLSYDSEGALTATKTYTYDTHGNRIEETTYLGEAKTASRKITYTIHYNEDSTSLPTDFDDNKVYSEKDGVTIMPTFKGGDLNTFRKWFSMKFDIPADAANMGAQGVILIKFVIEKDGSLSNINILMSPHPSYNKAVERVLKKCPKWEPGYINDRPVRVGCTLPLHVKFR